MQVYSKYNLIFSISDLIWLNKVRPLGKHERELSARRQKQRNRKRIIKCCGKNSCLPDEQRKANSSSKLNEVNGFTSSVCLIVVFYTTLSYFVCAPMLRKSIKHCFLNAFELIFVCFFLSFLKKKVYFGHLLATELN